MSFQQQILTTVVSLSEFEERVVELTKRLHTLTQLEEKNQTHLNGEELNILDRIMDKMCNEEKLSERDLLEIERITLKYL